MQGYVIIEPMVQTTAEIRKAFSDRLKTTLQHAGVRQHGSGTWLAKRLGITPKAVNKWMNSESMPERDKIVAIAQITGVRAEWLEYGIGQMLPGAEAREESVAPGPQTRGLVPVISWVLAGKWHEAEEHIVTAETEFLPCPVTHGSRSYALRVVGDSMTAPVGRSYPEGMIIYVDPDKSAGVGDRVIARLNGDSGVTFKQLAQDGSRYYLKPLNPNHPPIFDHFTVIGKVIGAFIRD